MTLPPTLPLPASLQLLSWIARPTQLLESHGSTTRGERNSNANA